MSTKGDIMAEVKVGKDESFEHALRRFRKLVRQEGTLEEARRREFYEKPSERKKKKKRR